MVQTKGRSWPELKNPQYLEKPVVTTQSWLEGKHNDDGAEGLWRVHDKLYDLKDWMSKHPGGEDFIRLSKGTDITELFEAHHIPLTAETLINKFYVKDAETPRNSPYTFKSDGFYQTLKNRVREELKSVPKSVSIKSKLITDSTIIAAFSLLVLGSVSRSYFIGMAAAFPLTFGVIASHNFFHQKSNWRKFYFDLSLMAHREWMISHIMSHHIYTNTKMDLEITMFEPFFAWLPASNKNWINKYLSWIYSPIIYAFIIISQALTRFVMKGFQKHDLVGLIVPTVILTASSWDLMFSLKLYLGVIVFTSIIFTFIGVTAAHHDPDLFHEGDTPREERDWGLQQLDSVVDRKEVLGHLPLTLFTFGDHVMHHLFPSLDHALLEYLHPILLKTCAEFDFKYEATPYMSLIKGQFHQLARDTGRAFPVSKPAHLQS